jgi:hypothetical protein
VTVPEAKWRWKNFSPAEIACRGTGKLLVNQVALDRLQALRDRLGKPLIVRSAYRSPEHNSAVGGAKRSKHMESTAFDIAMSNHDPAAFEGVAREPRTSAGTDDCRRDRCRRRSCPPLSSCVVDAARTRPTEKGRRCGNLSVCGNSTIRILQMAC